VTLCLVAALSLLSRPAAATDYDWHSTVWLDADGPGSWSNDGTRWLGELRVIHLEDVNTTGGIHADSRDLQPVPVGTLGVVHDVCGGPVERYLVDNKRGAALQRALVQGLGKLRSKAEWQARKKALGARPGVSGAQHKGAVASVTPVEEIDLTEHLWKLGDWRDGLGFGGPLSKTPDDFYEPTRFVVTPKGQTPQRVARAWTPALAAAVEEDEGVFGQLNEVRVSWEPDGRSIAWVVLSESEPEDFEPLVTKLHARVTPTSAPRVRLLAARKHHATRADTCRQLVGAGLGPVALGDAKQARATTVVYSREGANELAARIAKKLGAKVEPLTWKSRYDVVVAVGAGPTSPTKPTP
jgi:hypothetical protein